MTNIHQLNQEEPEEAFEEFYKLYPHNPTRRAKAKARALFVKITQKGGCDTRSRNSDSGTFDNLHLEATAAEIIAGVAAFRKELLPADKYDFEMDRRFVPYAYVWLNQGRWED